MKINHIASGSSGNAILVGDGETQLLLDAGISYKKIARHVKPTSLAGVLVSHAHGDHSKAVTELFRRGVKTFMSHGTAETLELDYFPSIHSMIVKHENQFESGSWIILPFDVVHDSAEPLGFLIQSKVTGNKAVYIVDSGYVGYNFKSVTHWLIECNYSEPLLEDGPYEDYLKERVRKNHFSLEDLQTFLEDSDLSKTEEIHLLHLSTANAHEEQFRSEIQKQTGMPVYTISDYEQEPSILKQ